jgi:hypothetical protein
MKKSWTEKFNAKPEIEIKVLDKSYWGYRVGDKMLIPSPTIIQDYINRQNKGIKLDVATMRDDLALSYGADFTCPLTTQRVLLRNLYVPFGGLLNLQVN